ncbi:MAG: DnaJ-class molecular chaperone with C-terminal Zn finger domain [Idiomarinaceae bacterium HL-53]|nr:MAG: DnaJ-class molecular chaperone with C-terminal Zn finger domain [Idiomarinaceae bacterium HL-53]CUS48656.1 DNA-J related protein [Idiomarinaceae bacterium HL-53]
MNIDPLKESIETVLLSEQNSLKEFELIQKLQAPPFGVIAEDALRTELKLFQTHFLVFHCLYLLRDEWRNQKLFDIEIDALAIRVLPYSSGQEGLSLEDTLRSYYLNLEHWHETTQVDVESLLNRFWSGLVGEPTTVSAASLEVALSELELTAAPTSLAELKTHYRKMTYTVHPDKGGSTEQMQRVQNAYQTLSTYLRANS